ncbi:hypothetical protein F2Q69_00003849 [Brassica cretica]|uniref:Uncharacterized protein n=1 Tax=Brassica cretica TaxID=69181 RepID=A0A8S9NX84_BRACR|nr:hypothetical protein F2Q69_00003849 [Brassica cretica]
MLLCQVRASPLTIPCYCIHIWGLDGFWDTIEPVLAKVLLLFLEEGYTSCRGTFRDCISWSRGGFSCFDFGESHPRLASFFDAAAPLNSWPRTPLRDPSGAV